jgi:mRNA interferase RelE/StbE
LTLSETPGKSKYRLAFVIDALKEWNALDGSIKEPLRKLLRKRLEAPRMPGAELAGELQGCYKIKLRRQGYRLVYRVVDDVLLVLVLAVDKREGSVVYTSAEKRLREPPVASEPVLRKPAKSAATRNRAKK